MAPGPSYSRLPISEDVEPFVLGSSSYPPRRNGSDSAAFTPSLSSYSSPSDLPYSVTSSNSDKGKAKAIEADDPDGAGGRGLNFCIRFTDGTTEDILDLYVTERETVRDVKQRLRLIRPQSLQDEQQRPRRLRLIQLGRMLVDGVFLVPYSKQLAANRKKLEQSSNPDHGLVDAVGNLVKGAVGRKSQDDAHGRDDELSRMEKGKGKDPAIAAESEEQIWLHCSVGDVIEDEDVPNEVPSADQQTTPLQGFDRLREAGFSEEEIESMRAEFRERRGVYHDPGEDDAEHQRALEEQWMSGMTGQEEASGDSTGTGHYVTLLKGVCVGFFLPFLPLFFFRTQIFSRRMQMAVVLGILINLGFGLLRLLG